MKKILFLLFCCVSLYASDFDKQMMNVEMNYNLYDTFIQDFDYEISEGSTIIHITEKNIVIVLIYKNNQIECKLYSDPYIDEKYLQTINAEMGLMYVYTEPPYHSIMYTTF